MLSESLLTRRNILYRDRNTCHFLVATLKLLGELFMAINKATLLDYAQRFRDVLTPRNGFRAAAYGVAMLGALGTASTGISVMTASLSPAHAQAVMVTPPVTITPSLPARAFTEDECRGISNVAVDVLKAIGPDKVTPQFKKSFRNFLGPNLKCDGPMEIIVLTADDIAVFNTIGDGLASMPKHPISLRERGLRLVRQSAELPASIR